MDKTVLGVLVFLGLVIGANALMYVIARSAGRSNWKIPPGLQSLKPYQTEDEGWKELDERVRSLKAKESKKD